MVLQGANLVCICISNNMFITMSKYQSLVFQSPGQLAAHCSLFTVLKEANNEFNLRRVQLLFLGLQVLEISSHMNLVMRPDMRPAK